MNENLPAMSEMAIPPAITASVNINRHGASEDAERLAPLSITERNKQNRPKKLDSLAPRHAPRHV
jgi:hypothetical protein